MKSLGALATLLALGAGRSQAQTPACCTITTIEAASGIISGKVTATGNVFQFKVADTRTLAALRVGLGVFANFATRQVSLDGRSACCAITSGPTAPTAAAPPAAPPAVAPPVAAPAAATAAPPPPRAPAASQPPASAVLPTVKSVSFLDGKTTMNLVKGGPGWNVTGGQEAVLRVELTGPAPCVERCGGATVDGQRSGYMPVVVSGNNPAQFNVQRVLVPTDQTVGEVRFVTSPVRSSTPVMISAWREGSAPQQATLTVLPPVMVGFVLDRTDVVAGELLHGTVTFTGPPVSSGAVKFSLQTTNSQVLRIPASVGLEVNKTAAVFDIVALGVDQDKDAQLVATYQDRILPASVAVRAASLNAITKVYPCCDNPFTISLNGRPPPQGAVIQLTSANPARMTVPPTVTIPPDEQHITLTGQSIPGNSATNVTITASYHGVSKNYSLYSRAIVKPDLVFAGVTLTDRFDNAITAPQDGQPFKLCTTVSWSRGGEMAPNVPVSPSVLRVSFRSPTGTGTSTGRDVDVAINFIRDVNGNAPPITTCIELAGLAPGGYYDVGLTADVRNEVDEDRESNNTRELKITRPPTA